MKNKKTSAVCNTISLLCWTLLLYTGIRKGNTLGVILYGASVIISVTSLIIKIISMQKEKHSK